ncbi:hypothetical protein LTR56_022845 [Elasticomyces elasticus]|nr:hypothetical protein LTR56_022845 [Elasticomyces elasticus]KAK3627461.1 hypothetical protein LTR22_022737 [Elasticomyces elasticus]KAK4907620.1 hypothetical protein LTR49_023373 [Elasticomyces elasticus]KAK5743021.1 hypothetical protein LTS12_024014 [Elasticomyces elasticus]
MDDDRASDGGFTETDDNNSIMTPASDGSETTQTPNMAANANTATAAQPATAQSSSLESQVQDLFTITSNLREQLTTQTQANEQLKTELATTRAELATSVATQQGVTQTLKSQQSAVEAQHEHIRTLKQLFQPQHQAAAQTLRLFAPNTANMAASKSQHDESDTRKSAHSEFGLQLEVLRNDFEKYKSIQPPDAALVDNSVNNELDIIKQRIVLIEESTKGLNVDQYNKELKYIYDHYDQRFLVLEDHVGEKDDGSTANSTKKFRLSNFTPELGGLLGSDDEEHTTCLYCNDRAIYFSVGPCDHVICYSCSLRRRHVHQDNSCVVCKADMPIVIFAEDYVKSFRTYNTEALVDSWDVGIKFGRVTNDQGVWDATAALLRNLCPLDESGTGCESSCSGWCAWETLQLHARTEHLLFPCDDCYRTNKLFDFEREFFTRQDLRKHQREQHGMPISFVYQTRPYEYARYLQYDDEPVYPSGTAKPKEPTTYHSLRYRGLVPCRYDRGFLLQFQDICKLKPSADWDKKVAEIPTKHKSVQDTVVGRGRHLSRADLAEQRAAEMRAVQEHEGRHLTKTVSGQYRSVWLGHRGDRAGQ